MNTFTKNMNPSKKNLIAMAEHTISAIVGIMVILGQFFKSLDNDFWVYMLIFVALFSTEFAFNSEEEKKRIGRRSVIIAIIATLASIAFYAAFKGIWILNAHNWYLFCGTAVATLNIAMIVQFLKSDRS